MSRLLGEHSFSSASKRLLTLLRGVGLVKTVMTFVSIVDDRYLRSFDRRYCIRTSGFIQLSSTSFDRARLPDATQYGPVNGWGFRRLLRDLDLPRRLRFVDLGCGLGRACILAAEYGFEKVTGVELGPELCATARENVAQCRPPAGRLSPITILQMDALEFCDHTEDDVFFMFRPFSLEFMRRILSKLMEKAKSRNEPLIIIYSERLLLSGSYDKAFSEHGALRKVHAAGHFGQAFWVYECGGQP